MNGSKPLYKNKCHNCGTEFFSDDPSELCKQCSIDEQNKEMGMYKVTVTVSEEELNDAQYGSVGNMTEVLEKVVEAAKKKGYRSMY